MFSFWHQYPALLYALVALFGTASALKWHLVFLLPAFLLLSSFWRGDKRRLLLAAFLLPAAFFWTKTTVVIPDLPTEGVEGIAHFEINHLAKHKSHFGQSWAYQGRLHCFIPKDGSQSIAQNIPCTLYLQAKKQLVHPPADMDYLIEGQLQSPQFGTWILKNKASFWQRIPGSWSGAEWRFTIKQSLRRYLFQMIHDPASAEFLTGIVTGEFEDHFLPLSFSKFGLQHIMAISGFHFSLIAAVFGFLLRLVFPKQTLWLLIIALSSYFLLLGMRPSIFRAWISAILALSAYLFGKQSSGLNSLGVALLFLILWDPMICFNLGLQLSALTTAAILLLFQPLDRLLERQIKTRSLGEIATMSMGDQHGYLLLSWFRQGVALALAVNLAALPLMLHLFHKFSWLSLLYNLFFPLMVSMSVVVLILAGIASCAFPAFGELLFAIAEAFTSFSLNLVSNTPSAFDIAWRLRELPGSWVVAYLSMIFALAIWHRSQKETEFLH